MKRKIATGKLKQSLLVLVLLCLAAAMLLPFFGYLQHRSDCLRIHFHCRRPFSYTVELGKLFPCIYISSLF